MSMVTSPELAPRDPIPLPAIDPDSIRSQLEKILESPAFRNSKRYPRFLRFVVEQTLLGHADRLKERLLGIEVFDRPADYDLAIDPIVRVAAGEIRKRLAQYYVEYGHENDLRIQLHAGTYVPEFCAPHLRIASEPEVAPRSLAANPAIEAPLPPLANHRLKTGIAAGGAAFCLVATLCLYWVNRPTPSDRFWKPFLTSSSPSIICLGDITPPPQNAGTGEFPGLRTGVNSNDHVALADVEALNRISGILVRKKEAAAVLNSGSATFADLRRQPVVLIGGSSNKWTMRAMQFFRFQLVRDFSPGVNGIRDRENISQLRWKVDFNAPYSTILKEYAIVARFHDPATDQPTIIAAGIGANGTVAAAEFLTTPAYLKDFADHAPNNWENRNVEIILETQMINGDYGAPHVVATYFW